MIRVSVHLYEGCYLVRIYIKAVAPFRHAEIHEIPARYHSDLVVKVHPSSPPLRRLALFKTREIAQRAAAELAILGA